MARQKPYNPALAEYQRQQQANEDARKRDRRARDLVRGAEVAPLEIVNPDDLEGDKIVVMRSIRTDILARLHSQKFIDEAQYQGGRAFQDDFEAIQSRPQAVDASQPYVDQSFRHRGISDGFSKAMARLNAANAKLGMIGSPVVHAVLIDGKTMAKIAQDRGVSGRAWEEHFGKLFRSCLDCLALVYGFAMEKR